MKPAASGEVCGRIARAEASGAAKWRGLWAYREGREQAELAVEKGSRLERSCSGVSRKRRGRGEGGGTTWHSLPPQARAPLGIKERFPLGFEHTTW